MRGEADPQPGMFSYVDLESRIPKQHPIRKIRRIVDKALPALLSLRSTRCTPTEAVHQSRLNS